MTIKNAAKFFDPVSGKFLAFDCETGDPVPVEGLKDCPEKEIDWEEVCIQKQGNTDPANVVKGWLVTVSYMDPFTDTLVVESTQIFDQGRENDLTADYEVTECVSTNLIPVGQSCYNDGKK